MNQRIINVLSNQLGHEPEEIQPESLLKAELLADSLDDVEIVLSLEKEFDIMICDKEACQWINVQDIFDYMEGAVK